MNLKFIFDIIDATIKGLQEDNKKGILSEIECDLKTNVLENLKTTLKQFIKDTNENKI